MKLNFWLYYNGEQQSLVSASLIGFGAEISAKANVIQGLDYLRACNASLQQNQQYDQLHVAQQFAFDYLVDSIRILIFFENYMKAELIIRNFCVHNINKSNKERPDLISLAKKQDDEPVTLDEVQAVEPFVSDSKNKVVNNAVLRETTIGLSVLLRPKYREYYAFDDEILRTLKELSFLRNKLHFNVNAEFTLSTKFIEDIDRIKSFIYLTVERLKPMPSN